MNTDSLGVFALCVCAAWAWEYRQTSGDVMVPAGYKPPLKKQCRSAAGLNQCYGCFMDCAHPIRALIKQERCGNGKSKASNSPQDYFVVY